MKIRVDAENVEALISRAAWLAYEASQVVGLGVLQARKTTEEELFKAYRPIEVILTPEGWDKPDRVPGFRHSIDYGFGRMMKYVVEFRPDGTIYLPDRPLNSEYESWCRKYPSYINLFDTAADMLGIKIEQVPA